MKKFAILLIAIGGLLSGCIAIPVEGPNRGGAVYQGPYRGGAAYHGDHDHDRVDHDRDGDGVPNNRDRRPNDPHHY
jgi:hypothetical protein